MNELGRTTITCPVCGEPVDLRLTSSPRVEGDTKATVRVVVDESDIRAHAETHNAPR